MKAILFPQPGGTIYVKRTLRSLNSDGDASVCLVMTEGSRVVGSIVSVGDESLILNVLATDLARPALNVRYYYADIDYVVVTGRSF